MLKSFYKILTKQSYHKEITENFLIPLLIGLTLGLKREELILLVMGCFLIDIDHLFYFFYKKKFSVREIKTFACEEFMAHQPHPYIFHCYELIVAAMLMSYYHSSQLFYLFFGFSINLMIDTLTYATFYKNTDPLLKYLSFNYLFYSKKSHR